MFHSCISAVRNFFHYLDKILDIGRYEKVTIGNIHLRIGIETAQPHKGKGYAFAACSALIKYCIENNYEPVWSCKKDNIGSYRLACRLGFEPTFTLPFYRLNY